MGIKGKYKTTVGLILILFLSSCQHSIRLREPILPLWQEVQKSAISQEFSEPEKELSELLTAKAFLLMDSKTGKIFVQSNSQTPLEPASTTKILSVLLSMEMAPADTMIRVTQSSAAVGGSSLGLKADDLLHLEDLWMAALVASGNDAASALSQVLGETHQEAISRLNLKALALGASQTHLRNPHGLPEIDHLSSAYDLALMARYAMANQSFSALAATKEGTVHWQSPIHNQPVKNTNQLLWEMNGINGVKTGTTTRAGQCLVLSCNLGEESLIGVVLGSENRNQDMQRLLAWHEQYKIQGEDYESK